MSNLQQSSIVQTHGKSIAADISSLSNFSASKPISSSSSSFKEKHDSFSEDFAINDIKN